MDGAKVVQLTCWFVRIAAALVGMTTQARVANFRRLACFACVLPLWTSLSNTEVSRRNQYQDELCLSSARCGYQKHQRITDSLIAIGSTTKKFMMLDNTQDYVLLRASSTWNSSLSGSFWSHHCSESYVRSWTSMIAMTTFQDPELESYSPVISWAAV